MTTEPLDMVYARLARKVDAATVACPNRRSDGRHRPMQRGELLTEIASCCHGKDRVPDPNYAALSKVFWLPCLYGDHNNFQGWRPKGTPYRKCPECGLVGYSLGRVLRPLAALDAGKLAEALREAAQAPIRIDLLGDGAAEVHVVGTSITEEAPTLLEALIRAADAAMAAER